jgi:DNA-binding IclR family transcriptional regulator
MNISEPAAPSSVALAIAPTARRDFADESYVSPRPASGSCPGRGVIEGAFAVLDALTGAENGLGLTALARASGLAKTSAYRLAEQLVDLSAVQRVEQRYYVGPRLARIGRHWVPDPRLREISQAPVHMLAVEARCDMTALVVLDGDRMRMVSATSRRGCGYHPDALDRETVARTAAGRILYATRRRDAELPDCLTPHEWAQLREHIGDPRATVTDLQDAVPGVCSVSAPVWYTDGDCAGAIFGLVYATSLCPNLPHLVLRAARRIDAALRRHTDSVC